MDSLPWILKLCLCYCAHAVLLRRSCGATFQNETDRLALLAFKSAITRDPHGVLSSWNDSVHYCQWTGVRCATSSHRVQLMNLDHLELVGSISPSIGNLSVLDSISLQNNSFSGKIPDELGRLSKLKYLNLMYNSLGGVIPVNITQCLDLRIFYLSINELVGGIPHEIGNLKKLASFRVGRNSLSGTIPPSLGNCSSLVTLNLARILLHGTIPDDLGRLSQLGFFQVYDNRLSGMVPSSLYNITSIYWFSVAANDLHGNLPPNLGLTLPNLEIFAVDVNHFQGPIPNSFPNATRLQVLDFSQNGFTGLVPTNLGSLKHLMRLNFEFNLLGSHQSDDGNVITSLANCTDLQVFSLHGNRLQGELPESISNLSSKLVTLTMGSNFFRGTIPTGIENLVNLTLLGLENNFFTGGIPFSIGKLRKLEIMNINHNRLSGIIPSSLGNLSLLNSLYMQGNRLEGHLPASLGNCKELIILNMGHNYFNGTIPKQILSLSSLSVFFDVSHNSLSGSLPSEVGNLINLAEIDLSENSLSGPIPATLANCMHLEQLKLGGNSFQGAIPQSLQSLKGIEILNFSHNNLFGFIPSFLMNLSSLKTLDLSYNDLGGEVPKEGIFRNTSAVMVLGNNKLCGGVTKLQLPSCTGQTPRKKSGSRRIVALIVGLLFLVLLSCLVTVYWLRNLMKKARTPFESSIGSGVLGKKIRLSYLDIFKSTNGFSTDCLIGSGSFGSVFKGAIGDEETVYAIKVINLQERGASKSFLAECETLRNIRHRNLLKIVTACESVDFQGNDFKALVYEFMPNGNLGQWLHPDTNDQQELKVLSLIQRLEIAIDVAFGLEYLHCFCETPIVHCDLKPPNILLDEDMVAHVGDFGLSRFLDETTSNSNQTISSTLKGSIGYIPPEYGMGGKASKAGDIYSYGILLLEMFTGKNPTDEMFKDGLSLYTFAMNALPNHIMEIVDEALFLEEQEEDENGEQDNVKESGEIKAQRRTTIEGRRIESLTSILSIGISCCAPLAEDRMGVSDVVNKMIAIRKAFLLFTPHKSSRSNNAKS